MNTLDFSPFKYNKDIWLQDIFDKHGSLVKLYNQFEPNKINDFDINIYKDQQIFKDFLQIRFIEELTEATEDIQNKDHFAEELIDAFNFLIASYIIYGYSSKQLNMDYSIIDLDSEDKIKLALYDIIQVVGNTCNCLKNRPWRKSQYLVDLYVFEKRYDNIWNKFYSFIRSLGFDEKYIYEQWSLKYQVNLFRLNTNY